MSDLSNIIDKLNNYPGLKALVEAMRPSAGTQLSSSSTHAFLCQLAVRGISLDRKGRTELSGLVRESGAKAVLRSELVVEFEKQGMSTENAFEVAEMFLELVQKEERNENRDKSPEDN